MNLNERAVRRDISPGKLPGHNIYGRTVSFLFCNPFERVLNLCPGSGACIGRYREAPCANESPDSNLAADPRDNCASVPYQRKYPYQYRPRTRFDGIGCTGENSTYACDRTQALRLRIPTGASRAHLAWASTTRSS